MNLRRKTVVNQGAGSDNQSNIRKKIQMTKKAAKDAELNKKMIIKKLTKDALRSNLMKPKVMKAKLGPNRLIYFPDVPDSDEEDEKEEEEDEIQDEFLDLPFICEIEVMKAKKNSLAKKISNA
mmetsp:Transcript_9965/g.9882  ORF Transcript_9965/g.9882 Transcript_9965/m.9882 type:complete len:123 (-) Transcript_9965:42-410(-)